MSPLAALPACARSPAALHRLSRRPPRPIWLTAHSLDVSTCSAVLGVRKRGAQWSSPSPTAQVMTFSLTHTTGEAASPYANKASRATNEPATVEHHQGRAATPSKVLGHKRKAGEYTPTSTPTKFAVAAAGGTDRVAASPPAASPSVGSKGRISQFFPRVDDAAAAAAATAAAAAAAAYMAPMPAGNTTAGATAAAASRDEAEVPLAQKAPWIKRAQEARAARDTMAGELASARSRIGELEGAAAEARAAAAAMKERCQRLEEEIEMHQARAEEAARAQRAAVTELASSKAVLERRLRREEAALASSRLGSIGVQRMGASLQEVWEDGLVPMNLVRTPIILACFGTGAVSIPRQHLVWCFGTMAPVRVVYLSCRDPH
jgi:hypothetical protein